MRYHRPKWMQPTTSAFDLPTVWALAVFATIYLTVLWSIRRSAWRDPTSVFFQPHQAYAPIYSNIRTQQSEDFLSKAVDDVNLPRPSRGNQTTPELCIGIPSVARKGVRYLRTALGSLLDGLTDYERDQIHLIIFFADIDPRDHPAFHEPWIKGLVDQILQYNLPQSELDRLSKLEGRQKGMFDFRYVLDACYNTGASHVALVEDDVLAVDGWFPKTMSGIQKMKQMTAAEGGRNDWLYLRMFYTEEFLGWNSESAAEHTLWSITLIAVAGIFLVSTRVYSSKTGPQLPYSMIISITCICLPLCIALFFLGGRVTIFPPAHGVSKMEKYGCCSQGLIFNREYTPDLLSWLERAPSGLFFDMQVEKYADEHYHLHRWAMHPPVLQHTGMKSSSDEKLKAEVAENVWSFEFELYDPDDLLRERPPKDELF